jgi:hypothetical protein
MQPGACRREGSSEEMKYLKIFGLAVVAAAALGAFLGAGTASATEACKATEVPCSEANMYKTGQEYHGVLISPTATLTGPLPVECKKSTFQGKQENTGSSSETLKVQGESLTFEECKVPGVCNPAVVTVNIQPTLEVHTDIEENANKEKVEKPDNGIVTAKGFTVTIVCGGITCKYSGEVTTGLTVKGSGTSPELIATKAPIPVEAKAEEFFCGKQGEWDATYTITTPNPLWVI